MNKTEIADNEQTILVEESANDEKAAVYKQMIISSLQTGFSFALEYMPLSITIYNLSQTGNTSYVGAFGLGQMFSQCCGYGIVNGLACGLETLVSQAYGAKKNLLCVKLYYRATYITILLMLPITLCMFVSQYVIYFVNGNQQLADDASIVTRYMVPSIFLNGIFVNTKVYLNGQNVYNLQLYSQIVSCLAAFGLGYYFIGYLDWGLFGACAFRFVVEVINVIALCLLVIIYQRDLIHGFHFKYLHNSLQFLKAAIPIGSILWLEWLCYDLYMMQASVLDEEHLTAHVLMSNVAGFMYQFSYGVSIAATTFVGNEMGALNPKAANKYCTASLILVSIFLIVTQTTLFLLRTVFSEFLTTNREVSYLVEHAVYLMNIMIILDGFQGVLSGLVRAIGREKFACYSFIFMYLVIGQSCTYLLVQVAELGLHGVWLGMILGSGGYDLLNIWNLYAKDWNQLSQQVHHKISKH